MNLIWNINNNISIYLNNFVVNNHLEKIIWIFSDAPIFFLPIFLLTVWFYYTFKEKNIKEKENILFIFYSVVLAILLNSFIKIFIQEKRPDTLITPILQHVPDNSFPSDHATVSFSFLFALYSAGYKKTFWLFLPFVIIMNFSRIAWWLHWFFDIFVWMILGLIAVCIVFTNTKTKFFTKINEFILKLTSYIKL